MASELTGDGLDAPEEGLHVLLAAGLVLVEVGPGAVQLVPPVRAARVEAVRLVPLDVICKTMGDLLGRFRGRGGERTEEERERDP